MIRHVPTSQRQFTSRLSVFVHKTCTLDTNRSNMPENFGVK